MNISWLHNKKNANLVVFFSGWGIEPRDMKFLNSENYDVAMLNHFDSDKLPEIGADNYKNVIIIAFSFGVYFAGITNLKADERYAFNGTLKPVDSRYGIIEIIFRKTLENLDETTHRQFIGNMFYNKKDYSRFLKDRKISDIEKLEQELVFIKEISTTKKAENTFRKVFISENDRIIPTVNQIRFWKNTKTEIMDCGHFPFFRFSSWDEIVEKCRT